jgi:hypothetical protein
MQKAVTMSTLKQVSRRVAASVSSLLPTMALLCFALLVLCPNALADRRPEDRVDALTGFPVGELLGGGFPDVQGFRDFIEPQREYMRKTYGEDIATTYDLFLKERARLSAPPSPAPYPGVLELKTIARWPDPVVLLGKDLHACMGRPLEKLGLFAVRLGRFLPIPYQFDEYTEDGDKVLPDRGPDANPQDGNGLLDFQDELVFMAHDLGDRAQPTEWARQLAVRPEEVLEIKVRNPLDGTLGWCYLVFFPESTPARSPLDYAAYNESSNQHYQFYVLGQCQFKIVGGKLYRQIFNCGWRIPDYAGGNFENFVDRQKFRVRVRLLFGTLALNVTEDDSSGDTLAVRDGPVRCLRRCWGRIHLPMGVKTPRIISDVIGYDTMFVCPVELSIPVNPGLVLTDLTLYSGTDLNAQAFGSRWYNSANPSGVLVDGRPESEEKALSTALDQWRLVTGDFGTMMNRSLWDPSFQRQAKITIRYTDDVRVADPPEYHAGQIGMAYNYSTVRNLKPGRYVTELDWFFPLRFHPPGSAGEMNSRKVQEYLDMYDHPLEIFTGAGWFPNRPRPRTVHSTNLGSD